MGSLGLPETIMIFVLALLLFGPKKLPQLGKDVAKALGEFRRASNELKDTWRREMDSIERETEPIKKEAESLQQVTSGYTDSSYSYDYNYDYGGYGYSEPYDSSANQTDPAAAGTEIPEVKTPEGVVPVNGGVETAEVQPPTPATDSPQSVEQPVDKQSG